MAEAETTVCLWLAERNIELRSSGASEREILPHVVAVASQHGVGKRRLSSLDCFHYAHAKASGATLLTTDALLRKTDVPTAP